MVVVHVKVMIKENGGTVSSMPYDPFSTLSFSLLFSNHSAKAVLGTVPTCFHQCNQVLMMLLGACNSRIKEEEEEEEAAIVKGNA